MTNTTTWDDVGRRLDDLAERMSPPICYAQVVGRLLERCPEIINAVLDDIEAQR